MRFKSVGNKRDEVIVVVKSAESSNSITAGSPVLLNSNGTDDGLAVKSAGAFAAAQFGLFYGIALTAIAAGAYGEAKLFGFMENVRIILRTRAASTDSWAARTAIVVGDALIPFQNTLNQQGLIRQAAGGTTVALPQAIAGAAVASAASLASGGTTSDASTDSTGLYEYITSGKAFIRGL